MWVNNTLGNCKKLTNKNNSKNLNTFSYLEIIINVMI